MAHKRDSIIPKGNHLYLRAAQINPYSHLTPYTLIAFNYDRTGREAV
jgi:hypothetical protein